jgi:hypothetical protein
VHDDQARRAQHVELEVRGGRRIECGLESDGLSDQSEHLQESLSTGGQHGDPLAQNGRKRKCLQVGRSMQHGKMRQLCQQKRVASALASDHVLLRVFGQARASEYLARKCASVFDRERAQSDQSTLKASIRAQRLGQALDQRISGRVVGAMAGDEQSRSELAVDEHMPQQLFRVCVGPVQVIDVHGEWLAIADPRQELVERAEGAALQLEWIADRSSRGLCD